jgi:hypothetical protein
MDLSQHSPKIFECLPGSFNALALHLFRHQYLENSVYHQYVDALGVDIDTVKSIEQIPYLPVRFFKTHTIQTGSFDSAVIFESSGTSSTINSRHLIRDISLYEQSFTRGFEIFYGPIDQWCIIGLLPSYLERDNSSLVYMVNSLIAQSKHPKSGFYLEAKDELVSVLRSLENEGQKTLLIGVTFALLDFANQQDLKLSNTIFMETGGMKGRRRDMVRQELHAVLKQAFGVEAIHSEYGMTEILSQAYSKTDGLFRCPPWMKILVRDEEDPLSVRSEPSGNASQTGVINIIDLANIHSCCFLATDDAGRLYPDGSFEVLGRIDNSDLRGCSLLTV